MKMRFYHWIWAAAAAALLLLSGCGEEEAPEPPVAQIDLMSRLMAALQERRTEEALNLAEKLQALDRENLDLAELHSRLVGNLYARKCSELLLSRGIDAALNEIRRGRAKYPVHLRLRTIEQQLANLKKLQSAALALRDAKDEKALSAALAAIAPLMNSYPGAQQLKLDIAARRKDLLAMRENARRKAEEARRKAEEERRKAEEERRNAAPQTESAAPPASAAPAAPAPGGGPAPGDASPGNVPHTPTTTGETGP